MKKLGFTLIEILITIIIIGILASLASAMFNNYKDKAQDATRIKILKNIESALKLDMPERQES